MARHLRRLSAWSLALAIACGAAALGAPRDTPTPDSGVTDLPLSDGDVQRVLYLSPERPVAALVMFTGGDGVLSIQGNGAILRDGNFLVRTRQDWVKRGFAVAIPDVPSDRSNLLGYRLRSSYGEIIRRIVAFVRSRTTAPIWLVGTSAGSPAAAAGAARLTHAEIAGAVLTSSVSRPARIVSETVFGADLDRIDVPVLIVSHRGDRCGSTPPSDGERIRSALTKSPKVEIVLMDGGLPPKSNECEAFAEHGYYGVETETVDRIASWIKAQP
ncbi:MAG TPA: hypothetical protein VMB81_08480 [Candidatus Sulfotelmatobacter sp.]|nr:hypothetical protein [Candidatus Sulfotelmatobacter sp.]